MRKAKKKAERDGQSYEIFDCWQYHWEEENRLHDRLDRAEQRCLSLEQHVAELEAEIDRLLHLVQSPEPPSEEIQLSLQRIVQHCKDCYQWEDVRGVVSMLYKLTRCIASQADIELIDSIEPYFISQRTAHAGDTYNNMGPVTQIPSVANYNAVVHEQNNQLTLQHDENKDEQQKLIEDGEAR